MIRRTCFQSAAVTACLAVSLGASAAEKLNVKPGLWEIDSVHQMSGVLPVSSDMRAMLTPAQIAKMQADMKAEMAKGPTRERTSECLTEKDLENPFGSDTTKECRQTIVTTSRTSQEVRFECDGERKGSGSLKVRTTTPESMTADVEVRFGDGAEVLTIKDTMKGRWLSADCGEEADNDAASEDEEPADDSEEDEE